MKRQLPRAAFGFTIALLIAVPVLALTTGEAETVIELPTGQHPEGIAFDGDGNLFYGNRTYDTSDLSFSAVLHKVTPSGKDVVIAEFEPTWLPENGLLGLVTDQDGDVWAALDGGEDNGVWHVTANGKKKELIDGSESMDFPNALTFDARGNLYATDSAGSIWRLEKGESRMRKWTEQDLLAPLPYDPFGFDGPGANGIVFFPPDSLYVANTEKGQLVRVPILANGDAGDAEAVTDPQAVLSVDGIAVDVYGDVYCVLPGSLPSVVLPAFPPVPPIVRVDTETGSVTRVTSDDYDELFDLCLSIAFSTRPGEGTQLYVTAGDLDGFRPLPAVGDGPAILRADVGAKGYRGK